MTIIRMCVGCKARRPTKELIRLRLCNDIPEGIAVDESHTLSGRSVYLCNDHPEDCAARAHRSRSLARGLRMMERGIPLENVLSALSRARSKEE